MLSQVSIALDVRNASEKICKWLMHRYRSGEKLK